MKRIELKDGFQVIVPSQRAYQSFVGPLAHPQPHWPRWGREIPCHINHVEERNIEFGQIVDHLEMIVLDEQRKLKGSFWSITISPNASWYRLREIRL